MLTNLIESRGKEFSNLIKIGDYLARSLRENVELFYCEKGKVTYLTESGHVINANYHFKPNLKLTNIEVEDSSILEDRNVFEKVTNKKVSNLLSNLLESDYSTAESSFDEILNLFETKLSYDRIKERLQEKSQRFGEQTKITSSPQFQKVDEVKDKLVNFLKENEQIKDIPEIKNAVKLASVISKSFNLPKITLESLQEARVFELKSSNKTTIYEHLCRQELIAKELLEAKDNFDTSWANNELINDLASMIYESKRSVVENKVAEIISKIPYFALATKKQLTTIIENCLNLSETKISNKEISKFVSRVFEMKKPVKDYVMNILNEKYGINVSNLTEIPTFSNLIKTESLIFNILSRLAPKNSVLRQTLSELSKVLVVKNGAESIDVADFLNEIFIKAGYRNVINETSLLQYLDFTQVAEDLGKIGAILKMLKPIMSGETGMNSALQAGQQQGAMKQPPMPSGEMASETGDEMPGEMPMDTEEGEPNDAEIAAEEVRDEEIPEEGMEGELPEGVPSEEEIEGEMEGDGGIEDTSNLDMIPGEDGEDEEAATEEMEGDQITSLLSRLEDLIGSLEGEVSGEEGDEEEEMGTEEGDEDEDVHIDIDSHNEEGEEEDGGEEGEHEDEEEDKALIQKMINQKMKGKK